MLPQYLWQAGPCPNPIRQPDSTCAAAQLDLLAAHPVFDCMLLALLGRYGLTAAVNGCVPGQHQAWSIQPIKLTSALGAVAPQALDEGRGASTQVLGKVKAVVTYPCYMATAHPVLRHLHAPGIRCSAAAIPVRCARGLYL